MEWIFNGIGTAFVSVVIGLIIGGIGGYSFGIKKTNKIEQNAGDNANQTKIHKIKVKKNN